MTILTAATDVLAGWVFWSLAHNLGHRWWHDEMLEGKNTFYAHGEREHHRVYDAHGQRDLQRAEDPSELFISFPLQIIAPMALVVVAIFGWLRGWPATVPFAFGLYGSMVLDHQLHKLFHRAPHLEGVLGRLQQMHLVHHATHNRNYFFVSGLVWDVLFGTAVLREPDGHRPAPTSDEEHVASVRRVREKTAPG